MRCPQLPLTLRQLLLPCHLLILQAAGMGRAGGRQVAKHLLSVTCQRGTWLPGWRGSSLSRQSFSSERALYKPREKQQAPPPPPQPAVAAPALLHAAPHAQWPAPLVQRHGPAQAPHAAQLCIHHPACTGSRGVQLTHRWRCSSHPSVPVTDLWSRVVAQPQPVQVAEAPAAPTIPNLRESGMRLIMKVPKLTEHVRLPAARLSLHHICT